MSSESTTTDLCLFWLADKVSFVKEQIHNALGHVQEYIESKEELKSGPLTVIFMGCGHGIAELCLALHMVRTGIPIHDVVMVDSQAWILEEAQKLLNEVKPPFTTSTVQGFRNAVAIDPTTNRVQKPRPTLVIGLNFAPTVGGRTDREFLDSIIDLGRDFDRIGELPNIFLNYVDAVKSVYIRHDFAKEYGDAVRNRRFDKVFGVWASPPPSSAGGASGAPGNP